MPYDYETPYWMDDIELMILNWWYWIYDSALYQKGTKSNGKSWNVDYYFMSPISDSLSGSMIVLHNLYLTLLLNSWRLSFQFQGATCEQPVFPGSSWFHGGHKASSLLPTWLTSRMIKHRILQYSLPMWSKFSIIECWYSSSLIMIIACVIGTNNSRSSQNLEKWAVDKTNSGTLEFKFWTELYHWVVVH